MKLTHLFLLYSAFLDAENIQVILMETAPKIRRLVHRDKKSIRSVSRQIGVSRNTVRKYLKDDQPRTYRRLSKPRKSKLTDYKAR